MTAQEVATIVATYEPYYCPPDLTLLLTVEHSVATTRLRGRADRIVTNSQRESMESPAFFQRWQLHMKKEVTRRGSYVEIDTSDLSRSEMLVCALDAVVDRLGWARDEGHPAAHRIPSIHALRRSQINESQA